MTTNEGHIPFLYRGQTFQTYYKIVGSLDHRARRPLVVLHGGPGFTHDYLLPHKDLITPSSPVMFYDQVGNGRSSHLSQDYLPLLSIEFFISELENLLKHFGIQDGYRIVGHSWGGMLAAEFVVRRHPKGLKRLVVTNSPASAALRIKSTIELLKEFPQSVRDAVANGKVEDERTWRDAIMSFYARHGCRVQPFPPEVLDTFAYLFGENGDRTVLQAG